MNPQLLLKNKYFYLAFIVFILSINYIFTGKVFGSLSSWTTKSNINVGNDYIRKNQIDNSVVGITIANIQAGKGEFSSSQLIPKSIALLQTSLTLVNTDVIELLDSSVNKTALLNTHVKQIEMILDQMSSNYANLTDIVIQERTQSSACESQKISADTMFFNGVMQNEADNTLEGLNNSLENAPCYITSRVKANAYSVLAGKVDYYQKILQQKHTLLINNQDQIVNNIDLFRSNSLGQLTQLQQQLTAYKDANYQ